MLFFFVVVLIHLVIWLGDNLNCCFYVVFLLSFSRCLLNFIINFMFTIFSDLKGKNHNGIIRFIFVAALQTRTYH